MTPVTRKKTLYTSGADSRKHPHNAPVMQSPYITFQPIASPFYGIMFMSFA
jgi:hypothetical protein